MTSTILFTHLEFQNNTSCTFLDIYKKNLKSQEAGHRQPYSVFSVSANRLIFGNRAEREKYK